MLDREEAEWAVLNAALGEALLDVERTFMNVVEHQSNAVIAFPTEVQGSKCLQAYLEAWNRLNAAHDCFRRFIAAEECSLDVAA